ncbi:MAG: two-component system, OmpR family, sensor histidine kinase KdpD [Actinomycetota bacterium]|jgi:signal transduction histidine kinase
MSGRLDADTARVRTGRADLAREARVAGLRQYATPSLEAVESRRAQLWIVAFVVMGGLAAGMLLLTSATPLEGGSLVSTGALRLALVALSLAFVCYVIEKEVHLRRLTRLLVDERVLAAAFSNRLDELRQLSLKETAVNANLHMEQTMAAVLDSAIELFGGVSGGVYLRDSDGLRLHTARGIEGPGPGANASPDGLAAHVAATGEPGLGAHDDAVTDGVSGAVMAAPLVYGDDVEGVLLVRRGPDGAFSDYDVRVLARFAEHSAAAVAHAALYEGERRHVEELVERDRTKSSFVAMVSHELKAPLAAIIGATRTLQRRDLPPEHVASFLEMIEKQGERLSRLVEDVLELRRAEAISEPDVRPVDLVAVTRGVCQLTRAAGRPVELRAPSMLVVNGDPEALEQILLNLIENAFVHGWGTVEVEIAHEGETVRLSVLDRGAGVSAEDARRVFDPFARGVETSVRGSGLGLHLVKVLAEAQGGTVTVSERPGGGADFTVRLPSLGPAAEAGHMTAPPMREAETVRSARGASQS